VEKKGAHPPSVQRGKQSLLRSYLSQSRVAERRRQKHAYKYRNVSVYQCGTGIFPMLVTVQTNGIAKHSENVADE